MMTQTFLGRKKEEREEKRKALIYDLKNTNLSTKELVEKHGISTSTVYYNRNLIDNGLI